MSITRQITSNLQHLQLPRALKHPQLFHLLLQPLRPPIRNQLMQNQMRRGRLLAWGQPLPLLLLLLRPTTPKQRLEPRPSRSPGIRWVSGGSRTITRRRRQLDKNLPTPSQAFQQPRETGRELVVPVGLIDAEGLDSAFGARTGAGPERFGGGEGGEEEGGVGAGGGGGAGFWGWRERQGWKRKENG